MPKIDDKIIKAIQKAIEKEGSQAALCSKTGISTSIMSRYVRGEVDKINLGNWNLLIPAISQYLPEHYGFKFPPVSDDKIDASLKKFPDGSVANALRMYNQSREEINLSETFLTDPRALSSEEKLNTIKTLTDKAYYLTTKQVNELLVIALSFLKQNEEQQHDNEKE